MLHSAGRLCFLLAFVCSVLFGLAAPAATPSSTSASSVAPAPPAPSASASANATADLVQARMNAVQGLSQAKAALGAIMAAATSAKDEAASELVNQAMANVTSAGSGVSNIVASILANQKASLADQSTVLTGILGAQMAADALTNSNFAQKVKTNGTGVADAIDTALSGLDLALAGSLEVVKDDGETVANLTLSAPMATALSSAMASMPSSSVLGTPHVADTQPSSGASLQHGFMLGWALLAALPAMALVAA